VALKLVQGTDERLNKEMVTQFLKIREEDLPTYPVRIRWNLDEMDFASISDDTDDSYTSGIDPEELKY